MTRLTVGRYRILDTLGEGGMGIVYRAQHVETGNHVALKTVTLAREELLQGVRREIDALARLQHPGIVRVVEHGVEGGRPWYAMDLLAGRSLRRYSADLIGTTAPEANSGEATIAGVGLGSFTLQETGVATGDHAAIAVGRPSAEQTMVLLTLARQLCEPLAFLHGEGLVHRDLKPDNLLVTPDDHVVIIDFGLATQFDGRLSLVIQQSGSDAEGTVAYMAPELIAGEVVDARADLYAFGAILYEMVSGRPPFLGSVDQVLTAHVSSEPCPLADLAPGHPAELYALVDRLLAKRPRDRLGHADDVARALEALGVRSSPAASARAARPYLYRPGFAGRADALARLHAALGRTRGSVFVIGGESGSGKTRLCLELAREASRAGHHVFLGECLQETGPPFEGLLKPLYAIADRCRTGGLDVTNRIVGAHGAVLAGYLREFADLPGHETWPVPVALAGREARHRVFEALADTFGAIATDTPTLLIVDDLQWADDLTAGFLDHLLARQRMDAMGVLLIGTYRIEETTEAIRALLAHARTEHVTLARLDDSAVNAIVGDMLAIPPADALCRHISRHAEGNPFFVAEYLRLAVEKGILARGADGKWCPGDLSARDDETRWATLPLPGSLRELIDRRLRDLPTQATALLAAGAILGRESDPQLLQCVAGLDEEATLRSVNELLRRQILDELPGGRLRFVHDKVREVRLAALADDERVRLHEVAGSAIESRLAALEDRSQRDAAFDAEAAVLAWHFREAGARDQAARYGRRAGAVAARGNSMAEAIDHFDTASRLLDEMPETPDVLAARIDVRLALYGPSFHQYSAADDRLVTLYRQAEQFARRLRDPERLLEAQAGLGLTLLPRAEYAEALASCERILGPDLASAPIERLRRMAPVAVSCLLQLGRFREAIVTGTLIGDRLEGSADPLAFQGYPYPPLVAVLGFLGAAMHASGRAEEGEAISRRACALAEASGSHYALALTNVMFAWSRCFVADGRGAIARSQHAARIATQNHMPGPNLFALYASGIGHSLIGETVDALRLLEEAERVGDELGYLMFRSDLWYGRALAHFAEGHLDRAGQECAHGLAYAELTGERRWAVELLRIAGASARRSPAFAERCLTEGLRLAEEQGAMVFADSTRSTFSKYLRAAGRFEEAARMEARSGSSV